MKNTFILVLALFIAPFSSRSADGDEGFATIFDGSTFDGW